MKLRILATSFVLLMQFHMPAPVQAAFPVRSEVYTTPNAAAIANKMQTAEAAPIVPLNVAAKPVNEIGDGVSQNNGALGLVSFALGIVGLLSIVAAVAAALPGLLALGFLSAVAAIITGAMSFKKKNKGFGIAGFAMGILEAVPLVVVVLILMSAPYKME